MILSMTGFGQSSKEIGGTKYTIEIKSLNGKTTDVRFKSNLNFLDKELELRKLIVEKGRRGKFEVALNADTASLTQDIKINKQLMQSYFNELNSFANENNIKGGDFIQSLIRLPNVVEASESELTEETWEEIKLMTTEALNKHFAYRKEEGISMEKDILKHVNNISDKLSQVPQYEEGRINSMRERIKKNLIQFLSKENVDKNRFEQEIIFYLEKLDINEEKVRLSQHCKYFEEQVKSDSLEKGKKLAFIAQEMGREINTLGAKAQQSDIQQLIVHMKDELEKIKEQVLNIL